MYTRSPHYVSVTTSCMLIVSPYFQMKTICIVHRILLHHLLLCPTLFSSTEISFSLSIHQMEFTRSRPNKKRFAYISTWATARMSGTTRMYSYFPSAMHWRFSLRSHPHPPTYPTKLCTWRRCITQLGPTWINPNTSATTTLLSSSAALLQPTSLGTILTSHT